MRRSLVIGNWKMHGSCEQLNTLLSGIKTGFADNAGADLVVCPAFAYLTLASDSLKGTGIAWAAQNVSEHEMGAYTGEVSAEMLADVGCSYVIVGHSERRALFAESDQQIANKVGRVLAAGMVPVLCVGETLEQRDSGSALDVVADQLAVVMAAIGSEAIDQLVLAYEPVWAIGTGRTASPEQAQEVHAFLRAKVAGINPDAAENIQILYGGSVKPDNAGELFGQPDIDGALVGGASLVADDFIAIGKVAG
ncbi:MAG: triose-phosphate isomerase [Pseudomonadales bacterium]